VLLVPTPLESRAGGCPSGDQCSATDSASQTGALGTATGPDARCSADRGQARHGACQLERKKGRFRCVGDFSAYLMVDVPERMRMASALSAKRTPLNPMETVLTLT